MRFLHTADWHVGKKLGREDRTTEVEAVLDELVAIATDRQVDLVMVAGDLFDRAGPPLETMKLVLETLVRLARTGAQVVAIPGNHDSAELFEVLAPLLSGFGIHLVHKILEPTEGGVVTMPARDGATSARIVCMPFIHEAKVIEIFKGPDAGFKSYADKLRAVTAYYADHLLATPDAKAVDLLMGHFMVHGAMPSGTERQLHVGDAYAATAEAIPASIRYAALGHIHAAQAAPGSTVPSRFAGSLLQLDFGEAGLAKSVFIVEVEPGPRPAQIEVVPITAGRGLRKVRGTLEELQKDAGSFGDDWLHVTVMTDGPDPRLAEQVREFLPHALQVRAEFERQGFTPGSTREGKDLSELYSEYHVEDKGIEPPAELAKAFAGVLEAAGG